MTVAKLRNPPLIEAIFELRWELEEKANGSLYDPYTKILPGKLLAKIESEYPFYEELPTAEMPDEILAYIVKYRFRKDKTSWPLVQLGSGIITLNDTENYEWGVFFEKITQLIESFLEVHPKKNDLIFNEISLRYVDALPFNFERDNVLEFLKDNLNIVSEIPNGLLEDLGISNYPQSVNLYYSFPLSKPIGNLNVRFGRGKTNDQDSLVWETVVELNDLEQIGDKDSILKWVEEAHTLTHNWFFKLVDTELLEEFK